MATAKRAPSPAPTVFVVFGATGDLAKRMVLPAFYRLALEGLLPRNRPGLGVRPGADDAGVGDETDGAAGRPAPGRLMQALIDELGGGLRLPGGRVNEQFVPTVPCVPASRPAAVLGTLVPGWPSQPVPGF